jgi:hypothetical protein
LAISFASMNSSKRSTMPGSLSLRARERRDLGWKLGDEGRLLQVLLRDGLEQHQLQGAPVLAVFVSAPGFQSGRKKRPILRSPSIPCRRMASGIGRRANGFS